MWRFLNNDNYTECEFSSSTLNQQSTVLVLGVPNSLHVRIPPQAAVPVWLQLGLDGVHKLHPCLLSQRHTVTTMPLPGLEGRERKTYTVLLETACGAVRICHNFRGEKKYLEHLPFLLLGSKVFTSVKISSKLPDNFNNNSGLNIILTIKNNLRCVSKISPNGDVLWNAHTILKTSNWHWKKRFCVYSL